MSKFVLTEMGGGGQALVRQVGRRELVVLTPGQAAQRTGRRKAYAGVFRAGRSEALCERADFKTTAAAKRWVAKARCS